jgi:hypothetical protein
MTTIQRAGKLAAAMALAWAGTAAASVVTVQTNYSVAGSQVSAADYVSVVDAAIAAPTQSGYGTAQVPVYLVSNQDLFGSSTNLAYRFSVTFEVTGAAAGPWSFRGGVDFGNGGAMLLDDTVLDYASTDLYWENGWTGSGVLTGTLDLQSGTHTLRLYGLEACCDGVQTAQYRIGDGEWITFASNDGLLPVGPIPEPATITMLLVGCAVLAGAAYRRRPS